MNAVFTIFVSAVIGLGLAFLLQLWMRRRMQGELGRPVGEVPEADAALVAGDSLLWFHSPSCGPCRAMEPTVHELEAEGIVRVVDVTRNMEVAQACGVMATPTTVRVKGGHVVAVALGVLTRDKLEQMATATV